MGDWMLAVHYPISLNVESYERLRKRRQSYRTP
jgi:hypothetical protein